MSISIPMMTAASAILEADWLLYLGEGTGIDRDRKLTLEHLFDVAWDINVLDQFGTGYNAFATRNASTGYMELLAGDYTSPGNYFLSSQSALFSNTEVVIDPDTGLAQLRMINGDGETGKVVMDTNGLYLISHMKDGGSDPLPVVVTLEDDNGQIVKQIQLLDKDGNSTFEHMLARYYSFIYGGMLYSALDGSIQAEGLFKFANSTVFGYYQPLSNTVELQCKLNTRGQNDVTLDVIDLDPTTGYVTLRANSLAISDGYTFSGDMVFGADAYFDSDLFVKDAGVGYNSFAIRNAAQGLMDVTAYDLDVFGALDLSGIATMGSDIRLGGDILGRRTDGNYFMFADLDTSLGFFNLTVNNIDGYGGVSVAGHIVARGDVVAENSLKSKGDILGWKNDDSYTTFAVLDYATGLYALSIDGFLNVGDTECYGELKSRSGIIVRNASDDGWNAFASRDAGTGRMNVNGNYFEILDDLRFYTGSSYENCLEWNANGILYAPKGIALGDSNVASLGAVTKSATVGKSHFTYHVTASANNNTLYLPANPTNGETHIVAFYVNGTGLIFRINGNGKNILTSNSSGSAEYSIVATNAGYMKIFTFNATKNEWFMGTLV